MMRGTSTARSGVPSGHDSGYGGGAGAFRRSPLGMPFLTHVAIAVTCLSVRRGSFLRAGKPGPCVASHGGIVRAAVAMAISFPFALTSSYDNSENDAGPFGRWHDAHRSSMIGAMSAANVGRRCDTGAAVTITALPAAHAAAASMAIGVNAFRIDQMIRPSLAPASELPWRRAAQTAVA